MCLAETMFVALDNIISLMRQNKYSAQGMYRYRRV